MENEQRMTDLPAADIAELSACVSDPILDAAFDAWLDERDAAYLEWRSRENEFAALDDEIAESELVRGELHDALDGRR